jgi:CDP-ribitol ribitolphosphotransferase
MNIIVFGTGSSSEKFLNQIDNQKVNIVGFIDNNSMKHNSNFMGYQVMAPSALIEISFDYVCIASQYSLEILIQLLDMGIPYSKIVPTDYDEHNAKNNWLYENTIQEMCVNNMRKMATNDKLSIAIVNYNNSNSNGFALYRNIPQYISSKYRVELITDEKELSMHHYDVICSSNHDGNYDGKHINIEMWHGFPIKKIGFMHEEHVTQKFINYQKKRGENTHLILSYSNLYSTFFNASFPNDSNRYRITGMPRNDLLFESGSLEKLEKVIQKSMKDKQVVFFLPTWRKGKNKRVDTNHTWDSLFGYSDESMKDIITLVENNDIILVVKLHPFEYNQYKELDLFKHECFYLVSEEDLIHHAVHLYELLPCAKLIITDYSSIYFDTLLIDIPILFAPTDLDEYSVHRGFLLEPYQHFTPGPTANTFTQLAQKLEQMVNGEDDYKEDRDWLKQLIFKYTDNQSSIRAWHEIDQFLTRHIESKG